MSDIMKYIQPKIEKLGDMIPIEKLAPPGRLHPSPRGSLTLSSPL